MIDEEKGDEKNDKGMRDIIYIEKCYRVKVAWCKKMKTRWIRRSTQWNLICCI